VRKAAAGLALLALAACDPGDALRGEPIPLAKCRDGAGSNRFVVENFYRRALEQKQVRSAFEGYVSPTFVEHKPDVASGDREGAIRFLEGLMAQVPQAQWRIVRIVADAEGVAVHATMIPAPGAPAYVIADFFRVADCRIVEHWDVVAGPPASAANPLPRFR